MSISLRSPELCELLEKSIPAHEPVLVVGKPGIGKTDIITQACTAAKADLIVKHPVVEDPTDYKGMPWVVNDKATFLPFGDLNLLINAKRLTVCFFDDIGQSQTSVQAALMQLFQARAINGHKISPHVVFMGATNDRTHGAGVQGILETVKSRFMTIVELAAHLDDWRVWAVNNGIAPEVIAFLNMRPELLSAFTPTKDMSNSPCPRTWHAASRALGLGYSQKLQLPVFCGAIGEGAGKEFTGFLRVWKDMVSPDLVLTNPKTAPIPSEPASLWALATALASRVKIASMSRYCDYLTRLIDDRKSPFAVVSMLTATAGNQALTNTPAYIQMMAGPMGELMIGR